MGSRVAEATAGGAQEPQMPILVVVVMVVAARALVACRHSHPGCRHSHPGGDGGGALALMSPMSLLPSFRVPNSEMALSGR